GSAPTTIVARDLLTSGATTAGYIGRSFYPDPLFDGAVDDFRVYRSALSAEQVAELVGDDVPTLTGLADDEIEVRTTLGVAPDLPVVVRGSYSYGYDRDVSVTCDEVERDKDESTGTSIMSVGTAGVAVSVKV